MIRSTTITAAAERVRAFQEGEKPSKAEQKALYLLAAGGRLLSPKKPAIPSVEHAETRRAAEDAAAASGRKDCRAIVAARANGCCEACGARRGPALHWDHFWGRAREESVEGTWMLCARCDRSKTDNSPNRAFWLEAFGNHVRLHGFAAQEAKVDRALTLERAQHPENARG